MMLEVRSDVRGGYHNHMNNRDEESQDKFLIPPTLLSGKDGSLVSSSPPDIVVAEHPGVNERPQVHPALAVQQQEQSNDKPHHRFGQHIEQDDRRLNDVGEHPTPTELALVARRTLKPEVHPELLNLRWRCREEPLGNIDLDLRPLVESTDGELVGWVIPTVVQDVEISLVVEHAHLREVMHLPIDIDGPTAKDTLLENPGIPLRVPHDRSEDLVLAWFLEVNVFHHLINWNEPPSDLVVLVGYDQKQMGIERSFCL